MYAYGQPGQQQPRRTQGGGVPVAAVYPQQPVVYAAQPVAQPGYVQQQPAQPVFVQAVPPPMYYQPPADGAKQQPVLAQPVMAAEPNEYGEGAPLTKDSGARFAERTGWRDPLWAALWALQTIVVFVLAVIFYRKYKEDEDVVNTSGVELSSKGWLLLFIFLAASVALSMCYLELVKRYAKQMIWATLIASVCMLGLWTIISFGSGAAGMGIICLILLAVNLLWIYLVRSRIPFSAIILETVAMCIQNFPHTVTVALVSIVFQAVWLVAWAMTALSIFHNLDKNNSSNGTYIIVYFFLCLSFYWTSQVIKNVVHVTVAGLIATWYFMAPNNMPSNPTSKAFKRSTTTSLGSICLGSLVVAALRAFRAVVYTLMENENELLRCCLMCILDCINSIVEYFNQYAYTHVAIYGKTYCEAAKDTLQLLKARGMDALINDQLISGVLFFGALITGVLTAGLGAVLAKAWLTDWGIWAGVGFVGGFMIAMCALEVVESAVCCLFVCYAEDPEALHSTKPATYERLNNAFHERMSALGNNQQRRSG